ncbi:hypothetical protein BGX34_010056 [Mortierella sp. NVP85]|nr:hypothetical protein BGX34_010056 [Mortierella sp. NVP85]
MLSDYYIGAAPWLISRARTTTAVMKTEDVIGTLEGPEKGMLAIKRKNRSTRSCNVLFGAAKQNHQNKLYAASAAKAAVTCAAVIESPSDEDDLPFIVAQSSFTPRQLSVSSKAVSALGESDLGFAQQ